MEDKALRQLLVLMITRTAEIQAVQETLLMSQAQLVAALTQKTPAECYEALQKTALERGKLHQQALMSELEALVMKGKSGSEN